MTHVLCKPLFPRQLCKLSLYQATPQETGLLVNLGQSCQPNYWELGKVKGKQGLVQLADSRNKDDK